MSKLLSADPYSARDDAALLAELVALTHRHMDGCPLYRRVWPQWTRAAQVADIPFLHAGVFKHVRFMTESPGIRHGRTLQSSATTSQTASTIVLDQQSSELQSRSTLAILRNFVGETKRPLLVLDAGNAVRRSGEVSARIAAAMSLRPLASDLRFLLDDATNPGSLKWQTALEVLRQHDDILIYGFTWILWLAWALPEKSDEIKAALAGKRIHFVHSGGWKRLDSLKVSRQEFDAQLLAGLHPSSRVVDYYGLVEQVGIIYPLCEQGFRHVPRWAEVLVRRSVSLTPVENEVGQLQLLNTLALGAPYHSVLTEDLGRIVPGDCGCGRQGRRFELVGRMPKAEVRGCANV
jgi:hypothetical protein